MRSIITILLALFFLNGCGTADQISDDRLLNLDHNGSTLMKKDSRNGEYEVDQYTQNPNVDISHSPLRISEAREQIIEVLKMEKGLELESFWTNGSEAWAIVQTTETLPAFKRKKREQEIKSKLQRALPRYDVNVQLKTKK